jgi:hypothetical protein
MTYHINYTDQSTGKYINRAIKASTMEDAHMIFHEECQEQKIKVDSFTISGPK